MAEPRTEARFPGVAEPRGHYESFYMRACHPVEPLGVWIRYTVLKHPGQRPRGSLWFTLFDGAAGAPQAWKVTLGPGELAARPEYIRIGSGRFDPGRLAGEAGEASWALDYSDGEATLRHLPRPWMYTAAIPRTKLLSPHPAAVFSGEVTVSGRRIELDGWRGMVGHNWGAQHAERWIWMHGIDFEGAGDAWLDAAIGRVKVGPFTTPWIANGALSVDGRRHALGGPGAVRKTRIEDRADGCSFVIPGDGITVRGRVDAAAKDFVGWVYSDPDASEHNTLNCSIARMELTLERPGTGPATLVSEHGGVYEIGMRETDHGVPIQPFPDP